MPIDPSQVIQGCWKAQLSIGVCFLFLACSRPNEPSDNKPYNANVANLGPATSNSVAVKEESHTPMDHRIPAPADSQKMEDDKLVWLVIDRIWKWADFYGKYEPFRNQLAELTAGQRAVYCTTWLKSEVDNGGFDQFFENSTGMLGPEALAGFKLLDMPEMASAVQYAFDFAKMDPYPRERDERIDRFMARKATRDEWDEVSDRFYDADDDKTTSDKYDSSVSRKQAAYIRTHPEEFFRTD